MPAGMTNEDTMFSVREVPWHRQGTVLGEYPGRDEAKRMAGLDWTVEEQPLWRPGIGWDTDWKTLSRSDTKGLLNVARSTYGVAQNDLAFDILETLIGADRAALYETGGSIHGGAKCYVTVRIDESFFIIGDPSPTFPMLAVTWSHDGSAAMTARATTVRIVCGNTYSAAEAESARTDRNFTFRHNHNIADKVAEAKVALSGLRQETAAFIELATELAGIEVSDVQREDFVREFIPAPAATVIVSDRVLDNITTERNKVRALLTEGSATIPERHQHTAYGLMLAGSEYADHGRGFRNRDTYTQRTLLSKSKLKTALVPMIRELVGA